MNQTFTTIDIVGAGGLGTPAAWALAQSAFPHPCRIRIHDFDTVQLSNLHRQTLFDSADIGKQKAVCLAEKLQARFGSSQYVFEALPHALNADSLESIADSSIVIEATDSVESKFLLNDFCARAGIPFCYGGAVGFHGQALLFQPSDPQSGCLRCLFPDLNEQDATCLGPTCQQAGVLGPVVGMIGAVQASLAAAAINETVAFEHGSPLFRFDFRSLRAHEGRVKRAAGCVLHQPQKALRSLDLTQKKCPATFLYTKLALEQIGAGSLLEVRFGDADSAKNVYASVQEEGHQVSGPPIQTETGTWVLKIIPRAS